ncbi:hypothetical protein Daesc_007295 [Daldinia eschscholtzii]|uniref:Uncharacterized protein n=1 Tax=Daldinia eschscholtzii TaxID=292717 RepID=A0AAX6MDP2_9PEZI
MSAHLCKQIQKSFQTRQTSPEPLGTTTTTTTYLPTYLRRSPSPQPEKRTSVDSDRSDSSAHTVSSSIGLEAFKENRMWRWILSDDVTGSWSMELIPPLLKPRIGENISTSDTSIGRTKRTTDE